MRLIKCRKCGATIATDEAFVQRMLDAISSLNEKARKDRKNIVTYQQEASAIKKIMTQYLHTSAQMDTELRRMIYEQKELVQYVVDNGLLGYEKIDELRNIAREKCKIADDKDRQKIDELYGGFENIMINRTKRDPTEREATKS